MNIPNHIGASLPIDIIVPKNMKVESYWEHDSIGQFKRILYRVYHLVPCCFFWERWKIVEGFDEDHSAYGTLNFCEQSLKTYIENYNLGIIADSCIMVDTVVGEGTDDPDEPHMTSKPPY